MLGGAYVRFECSGCGGTCHRVAFQVFEMLWHLANYVACDCTECGSKYVRYWSLSRPSPSPSPTSTVSSPNSAELVSVGKLGFTALSGARGLRQHPIDEPMPAVACKNRGFLASTEKMGRSEGSGAPAERILHKCMASSRLCLDGDPIQ